ncbi:MAG: hypothetical protein M3R67_07860 [Acidobacteriota bacterium]|nr:hypothetical protein [Acidobacteriota bacterium]MDQ2937410.1 hypothetical protein [Acidobacteriota bacterium]
MAFIISYFSFFIDATAKKQAIAQKQGSSGDSKEITAKKEGMSSMTDEKYEMRNEKSSLLLELC